LTEITKMNDARMMQEVLENPVPEANTTE